MASATAKPNSNRQTAPRRARRTGPHKAPQKTPLPGRVVEGAVVELIDHRTARVVLPGGRSLSVRLPLHVSPAWLRAALLLAPVDAGIALVGPERALLWCLFPSPAHEAVVADVVIVGRNVQIRAEGQLQIEGPKAFVKLEVNGKATVRGKEVVTRASGTNFIKGGSVRIN